MYISSRDTWSNVKHLVHIQVEIISEVISLCCQLPLHSTNQNHRLKGAHGYGIMNKHSALRTRSVWSLRGRDQRGHEEICKYPAFLAIKGQNLRKSSQSPHLVLPTDRTTQRSKSELKFLRTTRDAEIVHFVIYSVTPSDSCSMARTPIFVEAASSGSG